MIQRRRPKQDFNINVEKIHELNIPFVQQHILKKALQLHKANCQYEYKNLLNNDFIKDLNISIPTLIKNREKLINANYFKLKKVRVGKSYVLQYHFTWSKLKKLSIIIPIEQSEFKPKFKKKDKQYFKNGHNLSKEDITKLNANTIYQIKKYRIDNNGKRKGNGIALKPNGKDLKSMIQIADRTKEFECAITN